MEIAAQNGAPSGQEPTLCRHERTIQDPQSERTFCVKCGLEIIEQPVQVGSRFVSPAEYMRRVEKVVRVMNNEIQLQQRTKNAMLAGLGRIRAIPCRELGCQGIAFGHAQRCPVHQQQRARATGRERIRRFRVRKTSARVTPLQAPTNEEKCQPVSTVRS